MKDFDVMIGLEIHAELNTKTKVFCGCKSEFGAEPNTLVCPVCLGLPGALPVMNKKALESTIKVGLALGSTINNITVFERKNYFYPDLAKGYQISQLTKPICLYGELALDSGKIIRINRMHLEEDAGKLMHMLDGEGSYIDFNRAGVPLIEIVTEPDITSSAEAIEFLEKLRQKLIYLKVSDCQMQFGGFRCDINISVKPKDSIVIGTRVEMKNLNSFRAISKAIDYEIHRQIDEINKGNKIVQQTRGWDENKSRNFVMREKEEMNDYRYFPDPDILNIKITDEDIARLLKEIPETVETKLDKYIKMGLSEKDARIILSEKSISEYFETVCSIINKPIEISHWILTDIFRVYRESNHVEIESLISAESLAEIIKLVLGGEISRNNAKVIFDEVINTGKSVHTIVSEMELIGSVDISDLREIILSIVKDYPNIIDDYKVKTGDIINFIMGNVMKLTNGKANVNKTKLVIKEIFEK